MYCRKCGQELRPGTRFCTKCGTPVPEMTSVQTPPVQQTPPAAPQEKKVELKKEPEIPQNQAPQGQGMPQQAGPRPSVPQNQAPQGQGMPQQAGPRPSVPQNQAPQGQRMPQMPGQVPSGPRGPVPPQGQMMPGGPQQPQKSKKGLIIGLVCAAIIIAAIAAAVAIVFYFKQKEESSDTKNENRIEERDTRDTEKSAKEEELSTEEPKEDASEAPEAAETPVVAAEEEQASEAEKPEKPKKHTYQLVAADVTWTEAFAAAQNIPGGYLVNINSEKEWNRIMKLIKKENMEGYVFWVGATRRGNSSDYMWVDKTGNTVGEPMNENEHWLAGEPSFYDSESNMEERYVDLFYSSTEERWVCNDTPDDLISLIPSYAGKVAYIVEIENE